MHLSPITHQHTISLLKKKKKRNLHLNFNVGKGLLIISGEVALHFYPMSCRPKIQV